ncbi:MAG: hypothetical protein ACQEQG_08280 [Bacillota bacterium]
MSFDKIKNYVEKEFGFKVGESYDMPDSELRFPGGAQARIEISGIENCDNLEAMIDEAQKRNITVHRVISLVKGATLLDDAELKEFAHIGAENNLEILVNPCASRGWDNGRQYSTDEGYVSGMRLRGHDSMYNYLKEIDRCLNLGIRGFLVTDEGMLRVLNSLREEGYIPKNTTFKVSVFAGHGTAAGGQLLQKNGADSFNPLADLTLPMLSSIRQGGVKIPLDIYMSLVESMGGFQRYHEAAEIARVASPVYYKIEPGPSEAELYNTWADARNPEFGNRLARERVKIAQIITEWLDRAPFDIEMNDHKEDLCVPEA